MARHSGGIPLLKEGLDPLPLWEAFQPAPGRLHIDEVTDLATGEAYERRASR